jgi:hypothetical protein
LDAARRWAKAFKKPNKRKKIMIELICIKSGLKFLAENRRLKIHPEIAYFTSHSDWDFRYKVAIPVIERGKTEGWDTIDRFKREIAAAAAPKPRPTYDFEGKWAAEIVGSDPQFRFERRFLTPVDTEGRFKRYHLAGREGFFETCYESGKGNQTRRFLRVTKGVVVEIERAEVEAAFPEIEESADKNPHTWECLECGAVFDKPGLIEWGGMGCVRCNN